MLEWSLYQNRVLWGELSDRPGQLVDAHTVLLDQIMGPTGFGNRLLGHLDPQSMQQHLDYRWPTMRFTDLGKAIVVKVDGASRIGFFAHIC